MNHNVNGPVIDWAWCRRWVALALAPVGVGMIVVAVSGCMLGPDYERPTTPAEGTSFHWMPEDAVDPNGVSGAWWQTFGDPALDAMVQEALAGNYDLAVAAANVLEAEALLAQSRGARWPTLDYSIGRTRSKTPLGTPIPGFSSQVATSYTQQFSISYITDVFGKLRRAERAAWADLTAARTSREALMHAIIAQVVRTRVQIATQQRLLEIARATTKSREATVEIVERRYGQGLVGPVDIYLARENLAAARAVEPQLEQSLALAANALDVLLGRAPAAQAPPARSLPEMAELPTVPRAVPAALLDRRPDVWAAEMQLAAATERIGVSIAAMFPDLTLSAAGGYRASNFDALTLTENELYSLTLQVIAPIFRGGQLRAQVEAAKARAQRAAAQYAKTVLTAMREVEDALAAEQLLRERLAELEVRVGEARRAAALAAERYSRGTVTLLTLLETERRRLLAENERIQVQGQLYNARIDLCLALGGDWGVETAGATEGGAESAESAASGGDGSESIS